MEQNEDTQLSDDELEVVSGGDSTNTIVDAGMFTGAAIVSAGLGGVLTHNYITSRSRPAQVAPEAATRATAEAGTVVPRIRL